MPVRLLLLSIACVCISVASFSQEQTQWLSDSSKAFQFGIGNNFGIETFDNKGISFKTHLSKSRAIRVGISFSGSTTKSYAHKDSYSNGVLVSSVDESHTPTYSLGVGLSAQYLWYFDTASDVFLFIGIGPLAEISNVKYGSYDSHDRWSVGLGGAIGVEWFASHHIAIHAEYQAAARYQSFRSWESGYEYLGQSNSIFVRSHGHSWSFSAQKVVFGLSVYF